MYTWVIFLHVFSVLGFLLAHGASAAVMFRVRAEREPVRLQALLDLSQAVGGLTSATALLLLVAGILGGFMGGWWGRGWIWAALVLFIAVGFVMSFLGRLYLERVRRAIGVAANEASRQATEPPQPVSREQLVAVLNSGQPMALALIGLGGLAVITWLMIFKPF